MGPRDTGGPGQGFHPDRSAAWDQFDLDAVGGFWHTPAPTPEVGAGCWSEDPPMHSHKPNRSGAGWSLLAAIATVALMSLGCTRHDLRGPGFRDQFGDWGANLRPRANTTDRFGYSTRAQEIERNVGY